MRWSAPNRPADNSYQPLSRRNSPTRGQEMRATFGSLDDLVGTGEDRRRDLDANLTRNLEVNHELELRGLPGRRVGGRGPLQRLLGELGEVVRQLAPAGAVARQTPRGCHLWQVADRGQPRSHGEGSELVAI